MNRTQEQLDTRRKTMHELCEALSDIGVTSIIVGGALLGRIRDNEFVPWDEDVDITVYEDEFDIKEVVAHLKKEGFLIKDIDEKNPKINVYKYDPAEVSYFSIHQRRKKNGRWVRRTSSVPGHFLDSLDEMDFWGKTLKVPKDPEGYLNFMYEDWKNPTGEKGQTDAFRRGEASAGVLVLNAGIYDLMHRGHLNLLRKMRTRAEKLVIVIHDDRSCFLIKDKVPVQDLEHRIRNLEISGIPDEIVITTSEDPAEKFKKVILEHKGYEIVYMRGDDLTGDFPGKWMLDEHEVEIEYLPYTHGVSSTEIRKHLCN